MKQPVSRGRWASRYTSAVALALFMQAGCRDVPTYVKDASEFEEDSGEIRLTYNLHEDRAPAFNPRDNAVTYVASGYPPYALRRGLLLTVSPTGGTAEQLLPRVQPATDSTPWFTGVAFSPDGRDVAFVELREVVHMPRTCDAGLICPFRNASAILSRGVMRVRNLTLEQDQIAIPLEFCCRTRAAPPPGTDLTETVIVAAHPFQQQFERDSAQLFRPSWSPDGEHLVYSNGLDLYLLDVKAKVTSLIPNTRDGVWPAWSPDGSRIVFTRLLRGQGQAVTCMCMSGLGGMPTAIGQWEVTYYPGDDRRSGTLVLINPDGSNARPLGLGDAPAWLPDGRAVVAQRQDRLWQINVENGTSTEIPGTRNGYEPAISHDGKWLVYSRRGVTDHDIIAKRF